jgi:trans-aconitate 2-methyltransferase
MPDAWNPAQYQRFKFERSKPFHDLLALCAPIPGGRAVDLGCGTGELTALLHARLGAQATLGIDSSPSMLAKAPPGPGLHFEQHDIAQFSGDTFDLVFSNAALQWLPDHPRLIARVSALVAPNGQLAVQVPANHDHPSHVLAHALAGESPFAEALGGYVRQSPVLPVERYAEILEGLGYAEKRVRLEVYGHRLESRDEVAEWVRGTLLTDYQKRLPEDLYSRYIETYRERLAAALPDSRPYFYAFKRVLFWARRAA